MVHLRQTSSVQQYWRKFDELMNRVELPPSYIMSYFIARLRSDIALRFQAHMPKDLQDATMIATLIEKSFEGDPELRAD